MQDTEEVVATPRQKAKKKLKNFDFSGENASVSLVGPAQGDAANGFKVLAIKSTRSPEFIAKASQVKVTMEITEFLRRMFNIYGDDAEVLARAMGYKTAMQDKQEIEMQEEALESKEPAEMPEEREGEEYEDYIMSKLEAFEIMKSLHESEEVMQELSNLDEETMLAVLRDQATLEKALRKIERAEKAILKAQKESNQAALVKAEDTSNIDVEVKQVEVLTSNINKASKETDMQEQEVQVEQQVEQAGQQLEAVMKANAEMLVELQKAKDLLAQYEAEKKQAIEKARLQQVEVAVKDAGKAAVLFKAVKDAAEEDFVAVVKALAEMQEAVEKSVLFQEQGATLQEEAPVEQESAVAKILKAKAAK
jgi:hypothetical protein